MLKSILFTHDDLDGAGCHIVYELAHMKLEPDEFKIIHCSNTSIDNDVLKAMYEDNIIENGTEICFGDIVTCRENLEQLIGKYPDSKIRIWDHHRTNFFVQQVIPDATVIPENLLGKPECGTSLMFKYYSDEISKNMPRNYQHMSVVDNLVEIFLNTSTFPLLPTLVDTIRSYDTWEWKETNNITAKKLNILMWMLGMDRFTKRYVEKCRGKHVGCYDLFSVDQDEILEAKIENEQRVINSLISNFADGTDETLIPIEIKYNDKYYAAVVAIYQYPANTSELANQFLIENPGCDVFIALNLYSSPTFSIRTIRDDIDVSKIAERFDGGGHPQAAGFPLNLDARGHIEWVISTYLMNDGDISDITYNNMT